MQMTTEVQEEPMQTPINLREYYWFVSQLKKLGVIKHPIYPKILQNLTAQREEAKRKMKEYPEKSIEFMSANIRQASIKLIAVSSYGVAGFAPKKGKAVRFFCEDFFNTVTTTAQYIIKRTIKICEDFGFEVIYSDTDSVVLKPKIPVELFKLTLWADLIAKKINYLVREDLKKRVPIENEDWHIVLEPKHVCSSIIFTSAKKKYRAEVVWTEREYRKDTDLVGFEAKRSDAAATGR